MDGAISVREIKDAHEHQQAVADTGCGSVLGRGSFLGHGFRITRGASPEEARVEVYSRDRWWVMARATGLTGSTVVFVWDRAWRRVGRPWRDGVEAAVAEILAGVRDAV
ncbi:hypothetical protein FB566_4425 [Stackebrandtia endophytica]|uniref:Uncharacterized protein n=1 Tax=Stackebrandtia endophytica TaxID=1496996 RepID=A0A543B275_9ACTN|nr:hypothetical protein [Stackebrandtia endophytica]TQL78830.1 hypothetical protein FB566_4425 [Stackebrandtia endophytica]